MKFAIVDLGSNTIRLSVYNTLPEGGFDLLFSEKEMAGLEPARHRLLRGTRRRGAARLAHLQAFGRGASQGGRTLSR